jgi:antirestriction protein ArdC
MTLFDNQVISSCQNLLENMAEKPTIVTQSGKAYYNKMQDFIAIPPITDFESSEAYYQVYFHELIHWTGHSSRLNRVFDVKGSENYSKEELIGEIGASFLCAKLGIEADYDNSASYIQSWLRNLQGDKKYIIDAASKAQKAVDFILNVTLEESEN